MTIETSPVLVLDSFIALRAKSYTVLYSDHTIQKANQKVIQHTPHYVRCLFKSETTHSTNSLRSKLHDPTVHCQNKLVLNSFDGKRLYLNPIKSLPWDIHIQ